MTGSGPTRASHLSGSTAAYTGSTTSLNSLSSSTTLAQNGANGAGVGGPMVTGSIINQRADASRSLYQICIALNQRLALVPAFDEYLSMMDPLDPVESLWALLRTGHPLLTIFNSIDPPKPLESESGDANEKRRQKKSMFRFIQACLQELKIPSQECFVIKDLEDSDTTGFVKVCHNHVHCGTLVLTFARLPRSSTASWTWPNRGVCFCSPPSPPSRQQAPRAVR